MASNAPDAAENMTAAQILAYNQAAVATATGQVDQQQAAARAPLSQAATQAAALAHEIAVGTLRYVGAGRVCVRQAELGTVLSKDPPTKTCTVTLQTDAVVAPVQPLHVSYGSGNPVVGKSYPVFVPYTLSCEPTIERGPVPDPSHLPWLLAPRGRWLYYVDLLDGAHLNRVPWPPDFSGGDPSLWWGERERRTAEITDFGRLVGGVTQDGQVKIVYVNSANNSGTPFEGYSGGGTGVYILDDAGFGSVTNLSVNLAVAGSNNDGTELIGYKEDVEIITAVTDGIGPSEVPGLAIEPRVDLVPWTPEESLMAGTIMGSASEQTRRRYYIGAPEIIYLIDAGPRRHGNQFWLSGFYCHGQVWAGPTDTVYAHLYEGTDAATPGTEVLDFTSPAYSGVGTTPGLDTLEASPIAYDLYTNVNGPFQTIRLAPPVPVGNWLDAARPAGLVYHWLGYDGETLYAYVTVLFNDEVAVPPTKALYQMQLTHGVQTWKRMGATLGLVMAIGGSRDGQIAFATAEAPATPTSPHYYTEDFGATWQRMPGLPPDAATLRFDEAQLVDL